MLTSLKVKNFKRITNEVSIESLVGVNYLVGDNGCGKSSLLHAVRYFELFRTTTIPELTIAQCESINTKLRQDPALDELFGQLQPDGHIDVCNTSATRSDNKGCLIRFDGHHRQNYSGNCEEFLTRVHAQRELNLSELVYIQSEAANTAVLNPNSEVKNQKINAAISKLVERWSSITPSHREFNPEPIGQQLLLNLTAGLLLLNEQLDVTFFLLEEPENHLHPLWQKKLPDLLQLLHIELGWQFVIATHSPFIISSSGRLTDQERLDCECRRVNFQPSQKVYFMRDGQVAGKRGQVELDSQGKHKGRFGYWGQKCNYIAAKILGTGLMDFVSPQTVSYDAQSPLLILCEGQGGDADAKLYNIIFHEIEPRVLFVSARGSSQLYQSFQIITEIKQGLAANFRLRMVRDRDHEFPTDEDLIVFEKLNSGCRVLHRRAIECYLYDSEVVAKFLKTHHHLLVKADKYALDRLQNDIQQTVEQGIRGDDYKYQLKNLFREILDKSGIKITQPDLLAESLTSLMTPDTGVFQELYQAIFS